MMWNGCCHSLSAGERTGLYFFEHATDASWIPILEKRGYFAELPKAKTIEDGRVTFPFWRPIFYLERVSVTAPCLVVDTILKFRDTDNPRILHTIAEIASKVEPVEQSLRLKDFVSKLLKSPYHLGVSGLIAKLVNRWAGASTKTTDAALDLIRTAVSFQADPESQDKQARRRANSADWATSLGPPPGYDKWHYEQILETGVRPLAEREPFQTARILIDATATMIRLQLHQDELERAGGKRLFNDLVPARERTWQWLPRLAGSSCSDADLRLRESLPEGNGIRGGAGSRVTKPAVGHFHAHPPAPLRTASERTDQALDS